MAAAEARALLDQLMGGDRNAALPRGAALPRSKRARDNGESSSLLLPGKRHKSCFDNDICPLYCAWGVDVYELFVNTKSDIGPNPFKPEDSAREEYLGLPPHERERLGFEHMLFVKLSELVQQCDRTVQRNQEKLNKELHRQLQKRGGQDYVQDVDEGAVEQLCRNQIMVADMTKQIEEALLKLTEVTGKSDKLKKQIEEAQSKDERAKTEGDDDNIKQPAAVKQEESNEADSAAQSSSQKKDEDAQAVKKADDEGHQPIKSEDDRKDEADSKDTENVKQGSSDSTGPSSQSLELGKLTLEKQAILCDIARTLGQLGPIQEAVDTQTRNLNHVKSDITTDKTVCEVSGNFMSARDADERIAAHYAGKQYVGWKLVRDKFKEMLGKWGKYGPPPPARGPPGGGPPPMMHPPSQRGGPPQRGGFDNRRGSGGSWGGGGGGGGRRGSGGGGRGGDRWERGGGGYDRGYENRGGYDRGRRGSDNRGGGGGGGGYRGGGGWGRR